MDTIQPFEDFSRDKSDERRKEAFRDFLVVREIAGTVKGIPYSSRIPAELLVDTGGKVEISKPLADEIGEHNPTVMVHRSDDNEIESIEVICTCGKKVFVKFDYH
ncbi:MAG: hypothetical protein IPM69_13145 [Ignavibacteria bacterium]|nr:hypothetical protein [Ignavibacteria bacterium]